MWPYQRCQLICGAQGSPRLTKNLRPPVLPSPFGRGVWGGGGRAHKNLRNPGPQGPPPGQQGGARLLRPEANSESLPWPEAAGWVRSLPVLALISRCPVTQPWGENRKPAFGTKPIGLRTQEKNRQVPRRAPHPVHRR